MRESRRRLTVGLLLLGMVASPAAVAQEPVPPRYEVIHSPYLQLGDAPLRGYPGSEWDRVEIVWQTRTVGSGDADDFSVHYRVVGEASWSAAGPRQTTITGVGGREIHSVAIAGLEYDSLYEYRVLHVRGGEPIAEWRADFDTRLPVGALAAFSFAAYGDSAWRNSIRPFRDLQARLLHVDPAFALLLGDNAYNAGTHGQLDARFDPRLNPEGAAWGASHIDFAALGNHDIVSRSGMASEQVFASPVPVAGVSAPVAPPEPEPRGRSYSFDYGPVHFATFDTNSMADPGRLTALTEWLTTDLLASDQPWKIVFGHHPVAGAPDKGEAPGGPYFRAVVPALVAGEADLFLVGHSHTFGWTYPLTDEEEGLATYLESPLCPVGSAFPPPQGEVDRPGEAGRRGCGFHSGDGVIQVIAGVGGKNLRPGNFERFPFVAAGFSTSTEPRSRVGFALVDVAPTELTVSYVAADDGGVIGSFTLRRSVGDPWERLLKIG